LNFVASNQALAFVSNHDTERNGETLSYYDSRRFELATALMLAKDFGQPILYSGYAFGEKDQGPYETVRGVGLVDCGQTTAPQAEYKNYEWVCQHRWQSTINMIGFRAAVGEAPVVEKYTERGIYGFAREGVGYFITNVFDNKEISVAVQTTLPDGEYVDLIDGNSYQIVDGMVRTTLEPMSAIALLVD
jgi:alpha-amylase